jgi:Flp pilus assembly protein TadD
VQDAADVKYYRSDEPLRLGIEHFNRGNYGTAEHYFRDAVEKAPKDVTAWVGLAASYDRIARFDLADRAYRQAIRLAGETTEILNNQGYSYMLRGDLVAARAKFMKAYEREPNNPTIANNLRLLNSSSRFIQRNPN